VFRRRIELNFSCKELQLNDVLSFRGADKRMPLDEITHMLRLKHQSELQRSFLGDLDSIDVRFWYKDKKGSTGTYLPVPWPNTVEGLASLSDKFRWKPMAWRSLIEYQSNLRHAVPVDICTLAFNAGLFVAGAGVSGIIGNRADAAWVKSVNALLDHARSTWKSRGAAEQTATTGDSSEDDAAAASAKAAVLALFPGEDPGQPADVLIGHRNSKSEHGREFTVLHVDSAANYEKWFRVIIPSGDPTKSTVYVGLKGGRPIDAKPDSIF